MGQKQYAAMAIVGVVAAGLGGIIGIDSLLHAAGATHGPGSTAHYTVLAVLSLVIAVVGAVMAVYAEHRLHHHPGGRYAWALSQAWQSSHPGRQSGSSGRRRAHAPGAVAGIALITTVMACFGLVATLQAHSGAQLSSYTQSHGVTETAVADDVENIASHTSKGGYSYTNQITITVQHPAVGDGSATVYGNGQTSVQAGDTLTVLVDPKQPSYAEMPGAPYDTTASWIEALLFTIVIGCVSVFAWYRAVLMLLRHRRISHGQLHAAGA
jgi:hypothetical protein